MKKRIFTVLLTAIMLMALSVVAFAEGANSEIPAVTGAKGGNVTVNINLTNNPGIAGAIFKVTYDGNVITPVEVKNGDVGFDLVVENLETANEITIVVLDEEGQNVTGDGKAVSVVFSIADDDAVLGDTKISIECMESANGEFADVPVAKSEGTLTVEEVACGDVDGNGFVNSLDRNALARHIAGWEDYSEDKISMAAADVDGNGSVNSLDRNALARHIAGWDGYETLPITR